MAASLHTPSSSAPVNPGVTAAISSRETSGARVIHLVWTRRIASLPSRSGFSILTMRSNLPGRHNAESRTSGRLVAPRTMMPFAESKPSMLTRSWLSVCSSSDAAPPNIPSRFLPSASSSSMKITHGAAARAFLNRLLNLEAPRPTNISTNSDPEQSKNGTPASPAIALASNVLPVPGSPIIRTPLGILAPDLAYLFGFLSRSTISTSSTFASSIPATWSKPPVGTAILPTSELLFLTHIDKQTNKHNTSTKISISFNIVLPLAKP
mmetsp:Transcript_16462/g.31085  ORF Transcript_16462/g.31085 Transcript_16462/m.31085 type:complete len:266 (-) Transcript_16462:73-870(-)